LLYRLGNSMRMSPDSLKGITKGAMSSTHLIAGCAKPRIEGKNLQHSTCLCKTTIMTYISDDDIRRPPDEEAPLLYSPWSAVSSDEDVSLAGRPLCCTFQL